MLEHAPAASRSATPRIPSTSSPAVRSSPPRATASGSSARSRRRGTSNNSLWNVSCVSSTRCVAVGLLDERQRRVQPDVDRDLQRRTWSLVASPNRAERRQLPARGRLRRHDPLRRGRPLVRPDHQHLAQPRAQPDRVRRGPSRRPPTARHASNLLADVSCGDATHCVAVGYSVRDLGQPVPDPGDREHRGDLDAAVELRPARREQPPARRGVHQRDDVRRGRRLRSRARGTSTSRA